MAADLTIVSGVLPCLAGPRDLDDAMRRLRPLLEAGVHLVVYVDLEWKERLAPYCASESVRLHETSPSRRQRGFAMRAELEAAWRAARRPDLPPVDAFIADLTRMGMLHDQSIWNPYGTRHLAWMDADVTVSVHPGYFTAERVLDRLPALLGRFLMLQRPSAVPDAAGAAASRIQGQCFGGSLDDIAHINAWYYQELEQQLHQGILPTSEAIFTRVLDRHPERVDRFVLQENGLLGFFFEEMRAGRVAIERTRVHH